MTGDEIIAHLKKGHTLFYCNAPGSYWWFQTPEGFSIMVNARAAGALVRKKTIKVEEKKSLHLWKFVLNDG